MKTKFSSLLVCFLSLAAASAAAKTETVDGLTWTYGTNGNIAWVVGVSPASGDISIPSSLGGCPVTSIWQYAFKNCSDLTSITIPDSVTSIGYGAFYGCSGLTSIAIPDSVTGIEQFAFFNCSSLTSVTIPDGVTSIEAWLFYGCCELTSVTIPNGVTRIGNYAFYGCRELVSVTIPESVTSIGDSAFYGCRGLASVTIPIGMESIGKDAFTNCSGLTEVHISDLAAWCRISFVSNLANPCYYARHLFLNDVEITDVVIPDDVTCVGSSSFAGCSGFSSVTIPDDVTSIGDYAFSGCSGLASISIPNGVTNIGNYAFSSCTGLISVTIPTSVTSIGNSTFRNCSGLTTIAVPDSVTNIGNYAFSGCSRLDSFEVPNGVKSLGDGLFSECLALTSVLIPNSVTNIGNYAFYGCRFSSIEIPGSVVNIGDHAFYSCSGLTSITIPDGVLNIGSYAFANCWLIETVTIPRSVTNIGSYAFFQCRFSSITIPNGVTHIGDHSFDGCSGLTSIVVSDGVTSFGDYVFAGCSGLIAFTIPNSVTNIGDHAFDGCWRLTSITIPKNVTNVANSTFQSCSSLAELRLHRRFEGNTSNLSIPSGCSIVFYDSSFLLFSRSERGSIVPMSGNSLWSWRTAVSASANPDPPEDGVRYACSGWTGTGSVPASGTETNVTFSIDVDSTITWNWRKEYQISIFSTGAGVCSPETQWTEAEGMAIAGILVDSGVFGWTLDGDADGVTVDVATKTVRVPADRPRNVSIQLFAAEAAVENGGVPIAWHPGDDVPWRVEQNETAADGLCLRSGEIGTNETSTVATTVDGPGRISFDWKVPAGRGDYCRFLVDGVETNSIMRKTNWTTVTLDLGPGPHELSWVFSRGTGLATGENAAFLDNVAWRPPVELAVESDRGTPNPATGTSVFLYGEEIAATVSEPEPADGIRYVCTGWTGTGSVPADGSGTTAAFTITNDSSIVWNWRTNVWIDFAVASGGTTAFEPRWAVLGETVTVELVPDWHLYSIALSGDTGGVTVSGATLTIPADRPRTIRATVTERKLSLSVSTYYGTSSPADGRYSVSWNTPVEASVAEPEPANGYRRVCTGWTGSGSVPSHGTGTNVSFTVTQDSSLRWNWRMDVWIDLETEGPVSADFSEGWIARDWPFVIHWSPEVSYYHVSLSGDTNGVVLDAAARTISVPTTRPRTLTLHLEEFTLADALDTVGIDWTTDGDAEWFPQTEVSTDGEDAAQSGIVGRGDGWSGLEATLDGPGTLSWTWRLDAAEAERAGVDVVVDEDWLDDYAPGAEWSAESLTLGAGEHVVRFEFWNAGTNPLDRAWIDQVLWTGRAPVGGMLRVGDVVQTNAMLTAVSYAGDGSPPVGRTIEIATDEGFSQVVRSIPLPAITETAVETVATGILDDGTAYWARLVLSPAGGEPRTSDAVGFQTPAHTAPRIGVLAAEPTYEAARLSVPVEALGSDGGAVTVSVVVRVSWSGGATAATASTTLDAPGTATFDVTGLESETDYWFEATVRSAVGVEAAAEEWFWTPAHTAAELGWLDVEDVEQHDAVARSSVEALGSDGGPVSVLVSLYVDSNGRFVARSNLVMQAPGTFSVPFTGLSPSTRYRVQTSARTARDKVSSGSRTFWTSDSVPPDGGIAAVEPLALSADVRVALASLGDRYQNAVRGRVELSENEDFSEARILDVADDWTRAEERIVQFDGLVPKRLYHTRASFVSEPDGLAVTSSVVAFRTKWGEAPRFAAGDTEYGSVPALSFAKSDSGDPEWFRIRIGNPVPDVYYTVYTNGSATGPFAAYRSDVTEDWNLRDGYILCWIPAAEDALFAKIGVSRGPVANGSLFGEGEDTTWTISYRSSGAAGQMEDQTVEGFDSFVALRLCEFALPGHRFLGWSTTPGGPIEYSDGQVVGDIRSGWFRSVCLYAVWEGSGNPISDALDAPALSFTTGGDAEWFVQADETHEGGSALRSGPISHNQDTWIETTVTGTGTLSFWWNVSSEGYDFDYVEVLVDGVQQDKIGGDWNFWSKQSVSISGFGPHTVRWNYHKDATDSSGSDCAWLDTVAWTPETFTVTFDAAGGTGEMPAQTGICGESLTLATNVFVRYGFDFAGWATEEGGAIVYDDGDTVESLSETAGDTIALWAVWRNRDSVALALNPDLVFTRGGDAEWFAQSDDTHDGVSAARSGAIGHNGRTWIETTVVGPGTVTFWWNVSSEEYCDTLAFSIDGVQQSSINGTGYGWRYNTFTVSGDGSHALRWAYSKDGSVNSGSDCGWVDEVVWTPQNGGSTDAGLAIDYYDSNASLDLLSSYLSMQSWFASRTATLEASTTDFGDTLDSAITGMSSGDTNRISAKGFRNFFSATGTSSGRLHGNYADSSQGTFCAHASGSISIAIAGTHSFGVAADDGAVLYIDGTKVCSASWGDESTGTISLSEGDHVIDIAFYEGTGGHGFLVQWKQPGDSEWSPLPQSILSH